MSIPSYQKVQVKPKGGVFFTLTYSPSLDRISSVSTPIWRMLSWSQHEPWHSIPDPGPTSHCSDHTSSTLFPCTAAPPSSAPVFLCCPQRCPRSWEKTNVNQHRSEEVCSEFCTGWDNTDIRTLLCLFNSPLKQET